MKLKLLWINGIMVKEEIVKLKKILYSFYKDVLRRTIIFFMIGVLIILVFRSWRFNLLVYIIWFSICFGINFFVLFLKKEIKKEFYGDY